MDKENAPLIEMIAGAIGVFALIEECENFSYLHMMLGIVLSLYVLQGIKRSKIPYDAILYCAVASLPILLFFSKPVDWIRDEYYRNCVSRDVIFLIVWILLSIILGIIQFYIQTSKGVKNEKN